MSRLLFDFPPRPGASPVRRIFRDPVEVVRAGSVEDVVPALERIEGAVLDNGLSAAGYLAYEAAPALDPAFRVRSGGRGPLLWFGLYEGTGEPTASPLPASPEARDHPTDAPVTGRPGHTGTDDLDAGEGPGRHGDPLESWTLDVSPEEFAKRVARIHRAIEAGETYQVNFTARMTAHSRARSGDTPSARNALAPAASRLLYDRLRRSQGDGYHALLEVENQTIVSASPELFFQIRGRELTVRPMKGTRPRGRWLEEDEALIEELRSSEKEQAENRMIVDLLRNDLGRVAEIGSVRVPRIFDVERYRTVLQMTSTVTGILPRTTDFVDVLRALFPSGSVTGAPKIQTMKLIAELESSPREVYCGAIGYVEGGSGDAVFNVPIRTLRIDREAQIAIYGTGSGITWGSRAEEEYEEIRAKARILSERWPDFDLLETLRLEDGRYRRLERHLARMRDSASYFDRPFPEDAVRTALEEAAGETAPREGAHKVRITLSEVGGVKVTTESLNRRVIPASAETLGVASTEDPGSGHPERPAHSEHPEHSEHSEHSEHTEHTGHARHAGSPAPTVPVALATTPVDSGDRFLFHKTTHRAVYDSHRAAHPGMFDVLLWNEKDEITEFTHGNVVLEIEERRRTPSRASGLLAGCFRAELLEEGIVEETRITKEDLARARKIWLVNSVRGWIPVRLP